MYSKSIYIYKIHTYTLWHSIYYIKLCHQSHPEEGGVNGRKMEMFLCDMHCTCKYARWTDLTI